MTDDLVKRLRRVSMDLGVPSTTTLDSKVVAQAADRIEALEAKLEKALALLEGLDKLVVWESLGLGYDLADRVEATISDLKGEAK